MGTASTSRAAATRGGARSPRAARRFPSAYFKYLGTKGIRVRAPLSGRVYLFDRPGLVLAVDPRDRRALAGVPKLKQVAGYR